MTEILTRLLPAIRDVRNPLAIGYSWIAIGWALLSARAGQTTAVEDLFTEMTEGLSDLAIAAGTTFIAVLLGSGLVRLMDRLMQLTRTQRGRNYSPLDRPHSFLGTADELHDDSTRIEYSTQLQDYVTKNRASLAGWQLPTEGGADVLNYELDLFREHLADDPDFAAHQAENLLRFSLLPPLTVAAALSAVWAVRADDRSPTILLATLIVGELIIWFDYQRTGSLMLFRWQRLARTYPRWLPKEARDQRDADLVKLMHAGEGSRSSIVSLSPPIPE